MDNFYLCFLKFDQIKIQKMFNTLYKKLVIYINRWSIVGDSSKGKKVKFVESEGEVMKQFAAIELDLQMLTKIRHINIGKI